MPFFRLILRLSGFGLYAANNYLYLKWLLIPVNNFFIKLSLIKYLNIMIDNNKRGIHILDTYHYKVDLKFIIF